MLRFEGRGGAGKLRQDLAVAIAGDFELTALLEHARHRQERAGAGFDAVALVAVPEAAPLVGGVRTPDTARGDGRDHNANGYSMWLAGGGVKGGFRHGATDELGYKAVEDRTHLHDLHATILHLLGLDHKRLTCRYAGRDFRLTDVHGRVVEEILG